MDRINRRDRQNSTDGRDKMDDMDGMDELNDFKFEISNLRFVFLPFIVRIPVQLLILPIPV